jgi:hypothetical protein
MSTTDITASPHPEKGQRWTWTMKSGEVRHYIVTMAEAPTVKGPWVYLRNEQTGEQAMLSAHTVRHDPAWQPA